MQKNALIFLSLVVAVFSSPIPNVRPANEGGQRPFLSYSNNIVHENVNYPEQAGHSSVNVNFSQEPRVYAYPQNHQSYPTDSPQSQLFNVGYSVSFTNNKPTKPSKSKFQRNLEDAEIITGTRKENEEVEVPNLEYQTPLISSKKAKLSGIKAKPQLLSNYQNPKVLLAQANLSPNTQKYYKVLEQIKPQVQNTQELKQYAWKNLSPGVEIIRSTEVPIKPLISQQSLHFDHARALGRSEDFDQSNAIDSSIPQPNIFYNEVRKTQPLPLDTSILKEPLSIQIDTRLLDQALYDQNYAQTQGQLSENVAYLQQNYRTVPVEEAAPNKPVQVLYRIEQPNFHSFPSNQQNSFQFQMYGKPQLFSEANQPIKRQPRFSDDLHTNLRPPPINLGYSRRIRII